MRALVVSAILTVVSSELLCWKLESWIHDFYEKHLCVSCRISYDPRGIPVVNMGWKEGRRIGEWHSPWVAVKLGILHHQCWQQTRSDSCLQRLKTTVNWLRRHAHATEIGLLVPVKHFPHLDLYFTEGYSASLQAGAGYLSYLLFSATGDTAYLIIGKNFLKPLLVSIAHGGFATGTPQGGIWLEEAVSHGKSLSARPLLPFLWSVYYSCSAEPDGALCTQTTQALLHTLPSRLAHSKLLHDTSRTPLTYHQHLEALTLLSALLPHLSEPEPVMEVIVEVQTAMQGVYPLSLLRFPRTEGYLAILAVWAGWLAVLWLSERLLATLGIG